MDANFGNKNEQNVTVNLPDKCVEIQYPTEGYVCQVKDDQGQAVAYGLRSSPGEQAILQQDEGD